jgi:hypothetical protein
VPVLSRLLMLVSRATNQSQVTQTGCAGNRSLTLI